MPRVREARAIETDGIGSMNTGHLNLNKPLSEEWLGRNAKGDITLTYKPKPKAKVEVTHSPPPPALPKHNPLFDNPMSASDRKVIQLALAGNNMDLIDRFLDLMPGEAKRVWEKYSVSSE